ncbi:MAG: DNA repair protein RadC [Chitinispirillales bacterium]|nr:DNA repair protein RadC [Chitinispirillales bacterium]
MGGRRNVITPQPNSLPPPAPIGQCGHRGRLLGKYIKSGIRALSDYEILELLLTFALPRKDTKPIAKSLIARYGTVSAAVNAPMGELCEIGGLGERSAALFALFKDTMAYCLSETCVEKPVAAHRGDIEKYLRFNFGHSRDEFVAAIFLDNGNHILGIEVIAQGTVNRCVIIPRKIMECAMKHSAASFILVHNHPAGTAAASEEDWKTTERLYVAGKAIDIPLVDHIIISKNKTVSMRELRRWPGL